MSDRERGKFRRDMGEIAQLISCLMCGHKDPSSISSTPPKKHLGVVDDSSSPSIGEAETRGSLHPQASKVSLLGRLQTVRNLSQRQVDASCPAPRTRTPKVDHLAPTRPHLNTHSQYKHTNPESLRNCEGGHLRSLNKDLNMRAKLPPRFCAKTV